MDVIHAKEQLDQEIARLEAKEAEIAASLRDARALRGALDNQRLSALLLNGSAPASGAVLTKQMVLKPIAKDQASTAKEKILSTFKKTGNVWLSAKELMDETGLDRGVINNILYVSSKDEFESKPHPTLARRTLWRKKD